MYEIFLKNKIKAEEAKELDSLSGFHVAENIDNAYGLFENDEMIGYCTANSTDGCGQQIESLADDDSIIISDVYIKSEYRKRGLARYMLSQILQIENTNKTFLIVLHSKLRDLYSSLGFRPVIDEEGAWKGLMIKWRT